MFYSRGSGTRPERFTNAKITVFFLAAGFWLTGVVFDDERLTAVALIIALLAVLAIGVLRLRHRARDKDSNYEEP